MYALPALITSDNVSSVSIAPDVSICNSYPFTVYEPDSSNVRSAKIFIRVLSVFGVTSNCPLRNSYTAGLLASLASNCTSSFNLSAPFAFSEGEPIEGSSSVGSDSAVTAVWAIETFNVSSPLAVIVTLPPLYCRTFPET